MAMWNSRTNLWGKKTRLTEPVKAKLNGKATEDVERNEEYIEVEDKIMAMEAEIKALKASLLEKCQEITRLQHQLGGNSEFMQKVVMELIHTKTATPVVPARTLSHLEAYKAKKESEMSVKDINKAATQEKLP